MTASDWINLFIKDMVFILVSFNAVPDPVREPELMDIFKMVRAFGVVGAR